MKSEFIDDIKAEETSKLYSETPRRVQKSEGEEEEIEFVFIQENPMQRILDKDRPRGSFLGVFPMRTGYDKIWYGTGIAYFSGLAYGGVYGTYRGLATAPNSLFKVRMNSIVNQTTRYGPWAANSLGVLALSWAVFDNLFSSMRNDKNDYFNHVGAAFTTGFLFKSTAGLRQSITSGALLSAVVLGYGGFDYLTGKK